MKNTPDRSLESSLNFLNELFGPNPPRRVGGGLWDGTLWPDEKPRAATFVLKHPESLHAMFSAGTEKGLAGSAAGFARARLALYQTLLVKPDEHGESRLPLTRADWYEHGSQRTE